MQKPRLELRTHLHQKFHPPSPDTTDITTTPTPTNMAREGETKEERKARKAEKKVGPAWLLRLKLTSGA